MAKEAIPTPQVDAGTIDTLAGTEIIHAGAHYDMSMLGMFMQADMVVKTVIIMLLASSFISWTIIFDKIKRLKNLTRKMAKFEQTIWTGDLLEKRYERLRHTAETPVEKVFVAGMYEFLRAKKGDMLDAMKDQTLKIRIKDRVFHAMDSARNREISALESNLGFLATTGSTAPFIGLFGTVWGIMNSFQSIAMSKNTSLAVVAPGIAEALFATAIGLFAAIPAVIFYNNLSTKIAILAEKVDEFSDEFGTIIARDLDES